MTADSRQLEAQRQMTAALIADDPTIAELLPRARVTTPAGGFVKGPGIPRASQTFKLSLLAFDQRPLITVAGVERRIDYHLIGPWDMIIEVGDEWTDPDGTEYEVVGFSEGWEYMVKAFIYRRVPREANP
jgi:hypothetical protein